MTQKGWAWYGETISSAQLNMNVDNALLAACREGRLRPTVRVYGWLQPAITVGYSQRYESELDVERCRAEGIKIVRRPTGGRALLHHREISYAVVAPVSLPPFNRGLKATFGAISEALLSGLRNLGISGELGARKQPSGDRPRRSPACFAALNHCEIIVDGRKLVGSAQKRTAQAFLQHGSVILEADHERFVSLLAFDREEERLSLLQHLQESTTSLNQVCDSPVTFKQAAAAIQEGFVNTFRDDWQTHPFGADCMEIGNEISL